MEVNFFALRGCRYPFLPQNSSTSQFSEVGCACIEGLSFTASSMLRTILVQVFNCFRSIFRSIKPQFSKLQPKPAALLVWESWDGILEENLE